MNKKNKENLLSIFAILVVALIIFIYKHNLIQRDIDLSKGGIFTVGQIEKIVFPGRISVSGCSCDYIYYIDDTKYKGSSLCDKEYPVGSFFIVTYLPNKPEISRLEFQQPILADSVCSYFKGDCPFSINSK